jgi:N-acetylglucosamine-6-sulfatase
MRENGLRGSLILRGLTQAAGSWRGRLALAAFVVAMGMLTFRLLAPARDAPAQVPPARPNVVLVMTDDQTVEQMQALPRVRRLIGRAGTTFTQYFSTFPLCCPSRATYLTGQYAHNHGVRSNVPPTGGYSKLDSSNTLPVWLRRAGYATAHIGKYLNGYGKHPREVPPGWDEWYGSGRTTYNFYDFCLNENGRLVTYGLDPHLAAICPGATRRARAYQADVYTRKSVAYIKRRAPSRRPFFLSVAYLAPHSGQPDDSRARCFHSAKPARRHRGAYAHAPLPRPPSFNEADVSDKPAGIRGRPLLGAEDIAHIREDYQCRRESLLAVDEGVSAIVDALRSTGELRSTLFIFTSDNGFFQGEHRVRHEKLKVYEPSVRVPTLMRGPGVPRDRRVSELSGNIDLAETIIDAADARAGLTLDGVSLLTLARHPKLFSARAIVLENGPRNLTDPYYQAIRKGRFKYVEHSTGERELYDMVSDPFEERSVDRDPAYSTLRSQLAHELERLRNCSGLTCRR